MQSCSSVESSGKEEHPVQTLVQRQDLTGAARTWAEKYEVGDVLRYSRGSKETGIQKGEYARVIGCRCCTQSDHRCTVGWTHSKATIHAASRVYPSIERSSVRFL